MIVKFTEIKDSRMTRTILGMPSSCDITSYIGPEDTWGAVDGLDNQKITFEDVDEGIIYVHDEHMFYKIKSLQKVGFKGIKDIDSLHGVITTHNIF